MTVTGAHGGGSRWSNLDIPELFSKAEMYQVTEKMPT
jgi:hypothetical protein